MTCFASCATASTSSELLMQERKFWHFHTGFTLKLLTVGVNDWNNRLLIYLFTENIETVTWSAPEAFSYKIWTHQRQNLPVCLNVYIWKPFWSAFIVSHVNMFSTHGSASVERIGQETAPSCWLIPLTVQVYDKLSALITSNQSGEYFLLLRLSWWSCSCRKPCHGVARKPEGNQSAVSIIRSILFKHGP